MGNVLEGKYRPKSTHQQSPDKIWLAIGRFLFLFNQHAIGRSRGPLSFCPLVEPFRIPFQIITYFFSIDIFEVYKLKSVKLIYYIYNFVRILNDYQNMAQLTSAKEVGTSENFKLLLFVGLIQYLTYFN